MPPLKDLTGKKFGMLTPLYRVGTQNGHATWMCQCDCGRQKEVAGVSLTNGKTKSCGCQTSEWIAAGKTTHDMSNSRLYRIWSDMKRRCNNARRPHYNDYGGRGIRVCAEWQSSPQAFFQWALSHGYQDDMTLERIDVNGNYEPNNCCWIPFEKQALNKRSNHRLQWNGQEITMKEAADLAGIAYSTICSRINFLHWTPEDALSTPVWHMEDRHRDADGRFS